MMAFRLLKRAGYFTACLLLMFGIAPASGQADDVMIANYDVSYKGFRIGKAKFQGEVSKKAYDFSIKLEEAGLVSLFTSVSGKALSKGRIISSKFTPSDYDLDIKGNGKRYKTDMAFKGQRLTSVSVSPPSKPEDLKKRVAVQKQKVVGAHDPVSALIDIRRSPSSPLSKRDCRAKRRIFEGKYLFDLVLRYDKIEKVKSSSGLVKETVVCKGYLVYLAGHKKDGPRRTKEVVTVWLAKGAKGRLLIPFKMEFKLKKGLLDIEAYAFR